MEVVNMMSLEIHINEAYYEIGWMFSVPRICTRGGNACSHGKPANAAYKWSATRKLLPGIAFQYLIRHNDDIQLPTSHWLPYIHHNHI